MLVLLSVLDIECTEMALVFIEHTDAQELEVLGAEGKRAEAEIYAVSESQSVIALPTNQAHVLRYLCAGESWKEMHFIPSAVELT